MGDTLSNLFNAEATPQDGQLQPELKDMFGDFKGSNFGSNFGVYFPRGSRVVTDYASGDFLTPPSSGYVKPFMRGNLAHINTDMLPNGLRFSGTYPLQDTIAHELGHTVQPKMGDYSKMDNMRFLDYDENPYPKPTEILATLRAQEAGQTKGTTVWSSRMGREALQNFKDVNPKMSTEGSKRYLDLKMFPEHQVMHELVPNENVAQKPAWYDSHVGIIKNLFK